MVRLNSITHYADRYRASSSGTEFIKPPTSSFDPPYPSPSSSIHCFFAHTLCDIPIS